MQFNSAPGNRQSNANPGMFCAARCGARKEGFENSFRVRRIYARAIIVDRNCYVTRWLPVNRYPVVFPGVPNRITNDIFNRFAHQRFVDLQYTRRTGRKVD